MVMIFMVPEARQQLLEKGIVYTFRTKKHKEGKDWATDKRCGKKIADINVKLELNVECPYELEPYADRSGFKNVEDWWQRILDKYGPEPTPGFLYKATRLDYDDTPTVPTVNSPWAP
jgi:hypothetical protein